MDMDGHVDLRVWMADFILEKQFSMSDFYMNKNC